MQGSKTAITKLKTNLEANYSFSKPSKESVVFLIQETRELIDRVYALDKNDEKSHQIIFLTAAVSAFSSACAEANKQGDLNAFLRNLSYLREAVSFTYLYLTQDPVRSELELAQLADDVNKLKNQKNELEESISDLEEIISLKSGLQQSTVDVANLISDIKEKSEEFVKISENISNTQELVSDIHRDISAINKNINELNNDSVRMSESIHDEYVSVEDAKVQELKFIDALETLTKKSTQHQKEINKILGDANRVSMAASFKERKDELTKSIKVYDIVNYASLTLIVVLSVVIFIAPLFTNLDTISVKFFYERFLMVLPLGFISWFSSKRSQQLFQLREDYGYKYSSAVAFEGYQRQAENDEDMRSELLKIAISNLGKAPTYVFEKDSKHSPASDLKAAADGFMDKGKEMVDSVSNAVK